MKEKLRVGVIGAGRWSNSGRVPPRIRGRHQKAGGARGRGRHPGLH